MNTFGEWLREQRNSRKLTREEFANRVGCSVAMLRKIEDDERRPSAQIAELIANCLDIPSDERETFIKVARGELTTERLFPVSKQVQHPDLLPTQALSSNLPSLPTPLIGRESEVGELTKTLTDPQCKLLTIVGTGGIGKTRLAIETASQCQSKFANGTFFVPLAPIQASRFIIPVIADSIGFTFQGEGSLDPKPQLLNYLNNKELLLLIDNLEHLLADTSVPEFFADLMRRAPNVKLLVTSRESLGLQGEWIFEAQGLPIPESEHVEGTSVELFLQRARRAHVGFDATTDDYPAILRICRLVNGTPLGIELAAAWVRTLSCEEIAQEIERGLDFLSASSKDMPPRHRSMRAVFDHSWKLLPEVEQNVLLRLSIFQGGFSREAAQQVASASLPILSALVTKSLVRRSGSGRYDLHEVIRQYSFEELSNQPKVKKEVAARHGHYFMGYLRQQDLRLRSAEQRESLNELIADIDNIRSALEWALAHKEFALLETTMRAYSTLYDTLGWAQEALDYLGKVRDVLESKSTLSKKEELVALAHVLTSRSLFALRVGQQTEATLMLNRSLEILRPINVPHILVEALTFLGIVTIITGDLPGALVLFKEGLQTARDSGDHWYEALCLTEVVGVHLLTGEAEDIHEQFQLAVEAWRKTGDLRFTAFGLTSLSLGAMAAHKYDEAHAALEESIAINTSLGDRIGLANAFRGLGLVEQAQGKHVQALDSFAKSLRYFTELGARWDTARLFSEIGRSTFALGNDTEAERLWIKSLQLSMETNGILTALDVLVDFAGLHATRGNILYALQLVLICLDHPASVQSSKVRGGQLAVELKEKMTVEEIQSAQKFAEESILENVVREIVAEAL
ncbi:MAG: tetratricopeptide repeat protein [Anaerolineales bacterium]|nr:tetratricopeptide repeat protein [Anaerolineales bacterium]